MATRGIRSKKHDFFVRLIIIPIPEQKNACTLQQQTNAMPVSRCSVTLRYRIPSLKYPSLYSHWPRLKNQLMKKTKRKEALEIPQTSRISLDSLNDLDDLREELLVGLQTANLLNNLLGLLLVHDLGELVRLVVALDILKSECHLGTLKQG